MSDSYYRFFPGDYLRDTGDLTLLEHGAYMIMLHHYYSEERLPKDKIRLYRICRAFTIEEQQAVDNVSQRYFTENGDRLLNSKAEKELALRRSFFAEQARKSKLGVEARKKPTGQPTGYASGQPDGQPLPSPSPSPLPLPLPKPKKKNIVCVLPEFLSKETWELFLSHRKGLKAPIPRGGEEPFIHKFEKWNSEGWNPASVVEKMIEKGWRSFKPEWVKEKIANKRADKNIFNLTDDDFDEDGNVKEGVWDGDKEKH